MTTLFNQNINRIGFACKIQTEHDKAHPDLNTKSTTISYLARQTPDAARSKLWGLLDHNVNAFYRQLKYVAKLPHEQRMFRITSDLLPAYTHDDYMAFYFEPDVVAKLEAHLSMCGDFARANDIRLSFHPGQFCVLASEQDQVVENSITEFEYHCDLIRYMGYGKQFQDFKCNVHIGGKQGPDGIKRAMKRLSPEARNCLTIENAEFTWGLDASLELVDTCALVLDIHHHWIHSGGYIEPTDDRFKRVVDSWRGVRPVIHYSVSREDVLIDLDQHIKPDLPLLLDCNFTKAKLRAHSDYYWNQACNDWALTFSPHADIMCESKQKNLASEQLIKQKNTK
jgi:UV DNA damage repair endonuclease